MPNYHDSTAYLRHAMSGHGLDWPNQPHPFKRYRHRDPEPLADPIVPPAAFWPLALAWPPPPASAAPELSAGSLAAICLMSAGVTLRDHHPGLRAPASAGALYPAELYALTCGAPGLADALWHFSPERPGLDRLWEGPLAAAAARRLGDRPRVLTFFISAVFWKSVWKYRTRAYRYCLLDAGHMLANLELAAAAFGLTGSGVAGFADRSLTFFLGLAPEEEVPLAALPLGPEPADPGPAEPGLPPFDLDAVAPSRAVGRDQEVLAAHAAGNQDVATGTPGWYLSARPASAVKLGRPEADAPGPTLLEAVRRRRSRRNFLRRGLGREQVSRLLMAMLPAAGPASVTVFLGPGELSPGVYRYLPAQHLLAPVTADEDRRALLGEACLGQLWAGQAAMCVVLHANLAHLEEQGGPRMYREAMLAAGRAGQRLYLAATALGMGTCGVGAFFDEEVARAGLLPEGHRPLYVLSCGPVKGWPDS